MPGSVDDFMRRFGGDNAMDESEAAQYHERFVSTHDNDRDFDNIAFEKFWLHALVTGLMSGAVAHILFLINDLDNEFSGDWQVEKTSFVRARRAFDRTEQLHTHEPV